MRKILEHKLIRRLALSFGTACAVLVGSLFLPFPRADFNKNSVHSLQVTDRNGFLLREFLNDQQGRGQWRPLSEIAGDLQEATIAVEDKRFRAHPGVDPLAIVRAVVQNVKSGSLKSGGSGITQQVIRNVYHHPRTFAFKMLEGWYALRLEQMMSKNEILEQYLNRAPYGNQLFGVEAASRHYFQKSALNLSLAESALLAALPNAPSLLNPYTNFPAVMKRQKSVLRFMREQERISEDEYLRAVAQPIILIPPDVNFRAPHAVEMAAAEALRFPEIASVYTTIDYPLQQKLQLLVRNQLTQLTKKKVTNAAVVVIENATGNVLALVGSANYFDNEHNGQVNGALALRQPGSSIKPFTYGLAIETGISLAEIIPDIPTQIPDVLGNYVPENYDKRFHGPVRLRTALACSYNIPAVRVLRKLGIGRLYDRLQLVGLTSLDQSPSFYGYGLTLGNAEVRLLELTNAYTSFANKGMWKSWKLIESALTVDGADVRVMLAESKRIMDDRTAFLITDILSDPVARRPAFGHAFRFPFPCAVKTGTTKDYRDNWTLGYTSELTVGVWAGNFDGMAMRGVSGVTGAGGIFHDVMMTIYDEPYKYPAGFDAPRGLQREKVCVVSGLAPTRHCNRTISEWFLKGGEPTGLPAGQAGQCNVHQLFKFASENGQVERKTFEILSSEYQTWSQDQRLPAPPPGAIRISDELREKSRQGIAIVSPVNGEIFKIDPVLRRQYQTIKIEGVVPRGGRDIVVCVNKDEVLPFRTAGIWWELKRGNHLFRLEATVGQNKLVSRAVAVQVE